MDRKNPLLFGPGKDVARRQIYAFSAVFLLLLLIDPPRGMHTLPFSYSSEQRHSTIYYDWAGLVLCCPTFSLAALCSRLAFVFRRPFFSGIRRTVGEDKRNTKSYRLGFKSLKGADIPAHKWRILFALIALPSLIRLGTSFTAPPLETSSLSSLAAFLRSAEAAIIPLGVVLIWWDVSGSPLSVVVSMAGAVLMWVGIGCNLAFSSSSSMQPLAEDPALVPFLLYALGVNFALPAAILWMRRPLEP